MQDNHVLSNTLKYAQKIVLSAYNRGMYASSKNEFLKDKNIFCVHAHLQQRTTKNKQTKNKNKNKD